MIVTKKEIDDKRLEIVENLQLLERMKRRMHIDVYDAAIKAYAKVLAKDRVYSDQSLGLVRPEFRESMSDYMIDICGFSEVDTSKINKVKVALNNLVDQILSGENFYDNHNLFNSIGRKLGEAFGNKIPINKRDRE